MTRPIALLTWVGLWSVLILPAQGCADAPSVDGRDATSISSDIPVLMTSGRSVAFGELCGSSATVLLCWSLQCPCVNDCVEQLVSRPVPPGVRILAVAVDPVDPLDAVLAKVRTFPLPESVTFAVDTSSRVLGEAGFERAGQVLVLDEALAVCYSGTVADDATSPRSLPALDAVDDLVAGRTVRVPRMDAGYGCDLSVHAIKRLRAGSRDGMIPPKAR